MTGLTPLESALIPSITGLAGVVIGLGGNALLASRQEKREEKKERARAVAEVLTTTMDLVQGAEALHNNYIPQAVGRNALRVAAAAFAGLSESARLSSSGAIRDALDLRHAAPLFNRLASLMVDQSAERRQATLDLVTILMPRTTRFYAAVASPAVRPLAAFENSLDDLLQAVGDFMASLDTKTKMDAATERINAALRDFRAAARSA